MHSLERPKRNRTQSLFMYLKPTLRLKQNWTSRRFFVERSIWSELSHLKAFRSEVSKEIQTETHFLSGVSDGSENSVVFLSSHASLTCSRLSRAGVGNPRHTCHHCHVGA